MCKMHTGNFKMLTETGRMQGCIQDRRSTQNQGMTDTEGLR